MKALFSLFFVLVFLSACGSAINSDKASVPDFATAPDSSGDPAPPSGGGGVVVDEAGFFLKLSNTGLTTVMHVSDAAYGADAGTTNFSAECRIPYGTAPALSDYVCILEMDELDTFFNDLKIQYHIPSGMCNYIRVRPYWFYSYEPGDGPSTASYEVLADGTIVDHINTVNGVAQCMYNYTLDGSSNKPNCCVGTYNSIVNNQGQVTSTITEWGGAVGACIEGPAKYTQVLDENRFPYNSIFYGLSGINSEYSVKGPIATRALASTVVSSNYYNPVADHGNNRPLAMRAPAAVTNATLARTPQDTYTFECLDDADDFIARIRLFIREWNTSPIAEGGNPNVVGNEPVYGTPNNDYSDWGDFGNVYPASNL
ncbi:MAG: hypothetical protein M9962_11305 [Oligoflexia bacterium]|nr:hypothetical protein [Oligoflexia bacterium]